MIKKIRNSPKKLKHFLQLITNVTNNHHRDLFFFNKIEKVINYLETDIKQSLSNTSIFKIVFNSKSILFLLIKKGIITVEESFIKYLLDPGEECIQRYCHFFLPEIRKFLKEEKAFQIEKEILNFDSLNLDNYEQKRLQGENDSYICSLIRDDLIDEFVFYVNKNNISLLNTIKPSIFETNSFLINKNPTLIEYAAFYGSIQIFNYLRLNDTEIKHDIWIYAIHSNKAELIHLLEHECIKPNDESFEECFEEAIKCHHNGIADYILYNKLNSNKENKEKSIDCSFKYFNYSFMPQNFDELDTNNAFFYLCQYKYSKIIILYMKIKKNEIIHSNDTKYSSLINRSIIKQAADENDMPFVYYLLSMQSQISEKCFLDCKKALKIAIPNMVMSIERCAFYWCLKLEQVSIPSSVKEIGPHSFDNCISLKKVLIPSSVKSIGDFAFCGCVSLEEISFPLSVESIGKSAFYGCIYLKAILIPSSVTKLNSHVFGECKLLTKVFISSSVTSIEQSSFNFCSSLTDVIFESFSCLTSIGKCSFSLCLSLKKITIPPSVTTIGHKAFKNCSKLTDITIPSSVKSIGNCAFYDCISLTTIKIPSSVISIGDSAFCQCSLLEEVTMPLSVTSINNFTFNKCKKLTHVSIPSLVKLIGNYSFYECESLTEITIPTSTNSIGCYAFAECKKLAQIVIPSSMTLIDSFAFYKCISLTKITIPCVKSIKESTFYECSSLSEVIISSSVIFIEHNAFNACDSLTHITIPSSVTFIGDFAFYNCENLKQVSMSSSVTSIGNSSFCNCFFFIRNNTFIINNFYW